MDSRDPAPTFRTQSATPDATTTAPKPKKKVSKKKQKQSEQKFIDGYHHAHDLIYQNKDYAAGFAALRALHHDENVDVANLLGYSSRKLGNYDDAKYWYEKALVADPKHTRTWQYYGMWQIEQGNRLKAEEYLAKIETICGTQCEDYKTLKFALVNGGGNY